MIWCKEDFVSTWKGGVLRRGGTWHYVWSENDAKLSRAFCGRQVSISLKEAETLCNWGDTNGPVFPVDITSFCANKNWNFRAPFQK